MAISLSKTGYSNFASLEFRDVEAVEYFCFRFQLLLMHHAFEFASASSLLGFFAYSSG